MTLLDSLQWRYATKKFDATKKINETDLFSIQEALRLTPSSLGMQPWKFIFIESDELKKELAAVSFDQPQITDCSHLVVLCQKTQIGMNEIESHIQNTSQIRNQNPESLNAYKQMIQNVLLTGPRAAQVNTWSRDQVFIALGNLLTSAALLHIDTCAIGGFQANEYNRILDLSSQNLAACVVCALGYRDETDKNAHKKKVRFSQSDIIERR